MSKRNICCHCGTYYHGLERYCHGICPNCGHRNPSSLRTPAAVGCQPSNLSLAAAAALTSSLPPLPGRLFLYSRCNTLSEASVSPSQRRDSAPHTRGQRVTLLSFHVNCYFLRLGLFCFRHSYRKNTFFISCFRRVSLNLHRQNN